MNVDRSRLQRYGKLIVQLVIHENNVTFWRHMKYIHILYKNLCIKFQHLYTLFKGSLHVITTMAFIDFT